MNIEYTINCSKCSHEWNPRTYEPKACPQCKSRYWSHEGYIKCEVCKRNFLQIATHHKDGNNKNDRKDNLIKVCRDCHTVIHNGLRDKDRKTKNTIKSTKSRTRKYIGEHETIETLNKLRKYWLDCKIKGETKNPVKKQGSGSRGKK